MSLIEVSEDLFVGPLHAYEATVRHQAGWWVVHAAADPFHREFAAEALLSKADAGHPEYWFAQRGHRLSLHLHDAGQDLNLPRAIFERAVGHVRDGLAARCRVLIHCNQGVSRSPTVALFSLLALKRIRPKSDGEVFSELERVYPPVSLGLAMKAEVRRHWRFFAG